MEIVTSIHNLSSIISEVPVEDYAEILGLKHVETNNLLASNKGVPSSRGDSFSNLKVWMFTPFNGPHLPALNAGRHIRVCISTSSICENGSDVRKFYRKDVKPLHPKAKLTFLRRTGDHICGEGYNIISAVQPLTDTMEELKDTLDAMWVLYAVTSPD